MTSSRYEAPTVQDYGDFRALTGAVAFTGPEDGGSKLLIHNEGSQPIGP